MAKRREGRFGIDVLRRCGEPETQVRRMLEDGCDRGRLLERHCRKIAWLQHERLIHMLVTMLTAFLFFFAFALVLALRGAPAALLLLGTALVLLCAYLYYYFRLENTVQRWYLLADEIDEKIGEGGQPAGR